MLAAAPSTPTLQQTQAALRKSFVTTAMITPPEQHLPPEIEPLAFFSDGPMPGYEAEQRDVPKGLFAALAGMWRYQGV